MRSAALTGVDPSYAERGYAVIEDLLDTSEIALLSRYCQMLRDAGQMEVDHQVPGSLRCYAPAAVDALLDLSTGVLSVVTGVSLCPTYSFVRYYLRGQELTAHRDRPECEHSATVHLAASAPTKWPISLRTPHGDRVEVVLRPGDALLYRGDRLVHWRDSLDAEWYLQAFLHFVSCDGRHRERIYDGRPGLGHPR